MVTLKRFIVGVFTVDMKLCAETSDQNKECRVHAFLPFPVCVSLWHFLVYLRSTRPWPICCCKYNPHFCKFNLISAIELFCNRDSVIVLQVPNGVGSALGTMQLVLYFIYRDKKGAPRKQPPTEEESVELGHTKPHQEKQPNVANGTQEWDV